MKNKTTPEEFIGKAELKLEYTNYIFLHSKSKDRLIASLYITMRSDHSVDEINQFIADAINEKIERSKVKST